VLSDGWTKASSTPKLVKLGSVWGEPCRLSRLEVSEIVNLRRVRKDRARSEAQAEAAENRIRFGRTKAEREAEAAEQRNKALRLEDHLLTKRENT
jgi:hypothetical protein